MNDEYTRLAQHVYNTYVRDVTWYEGDVIDTDVRRRVWCALHRNADIFAGDATLHSATGEALDAYVRAPQLYAAVLLAEQVLQTMYDTHICPVNLYHKYRTEWEVLAMDANGAELYWTVYNAQVARVVPDAHSERVARVRSAAGSRTIGCGAYGRVVQPPIGSDCTAWVGKLFSSRNVFETEIAVARELRDVAECTGFVVLPFAPSQKDTALLQLRYPYAGRPLLAHIYEEPWHTMTEERLQVLLGVVAAQIPMFIDTYLATFGRAHYVHLDIKDENVLYLFDACNPHGLHLHVIDLSFACRDTEAYIVRRGVFTDFKDMYSVWPIEFNTQFLDENLPGREDTNKVVYQSSVHATYSRHFVWPYLVAAMDLHLTENRGRLMSAERLMYAERLMSAANAVDAWSIGMLALQYIDVIWQASNAAKLPQPPQLARAADVVLQTLMVHTTRRNLVACANQWRAVFAAQH